jgi:hypothetical protein
MSFAGPIRRSRRLIVAITLIAVVGLGSGLLLNQLLAHVERETAGLQSQLSATEQELTVRSDQLKALTSMGTAIDELHEIVGNQGELSAIVAKVRATSVPGVEIGAIRVIEGNLIVSGTAAGPAEYLDLVEALETSGSFAGVEHGQFRSGRQNVKILAKPARWSKD